MIETSDLLSRQPRIQVAVAVISNSSDKILITRRHRNSHQGGLWEFPGGKFEGGENVTAALKRELFEEIGIRVLAHEPLLTIEHDYGDRRVCLEVHRITRFDGEPRSCEGQAMRWVRPSELPALEFPAANEPIIQHLLGC